jgi:FdhE protein
MTSARKLLLQICELALSGNDTIAEPARRILDAMEKETLEMEDLLTGLLDKDISRFSKVADTHDIKPEALQFFIYSALAPSLRMCAEQLAGYLGEGDTGDRLNCPVCGNPPSLSTLTGEGDREASCSFCWHRWRLPRVFCTHCGNKDGESLKYFYSEEEKEYRVYVCEQCKTYIKTVDLRELGRKVYLPLEQVTTLHLDLKAREDGYRSGVPELIFSGTGEESEESV